MNGQRMTGIEITAKDKSEINNPKRNSTTKRSLLICGKCQHYCVGRREKPGENDWGKKY